MTKKKLWGLYTLLLTIILQLGLSSPAFSIPGDIAIWSPPTHVIPGSLFTVPITLDVGTTRALGSLALELRYDPQVVVINSITSNRAEFNGTLVANSGSFTTGVTRFSLLNNSSLLSPAGAIHVANIEFKVVGNLGSSSPIDFSVLSFSDTNALSIPVKTATPGHVVVFKVLHVASSDYDGDGKTDLAVWRPSNGTWYIQGSTTGIVTQEWGISGDIPVPGDYDGDGKTDLAVWRPGDGSWHILFSSGGTLIQSWGMANDIPVPGDYDGDKQTDFAVWRPTDGQWYMLGSLSGLKIQPWGMANDIPVPDDYDGDNITDLAIWRPAEGRWYISTSSGGPSIQRLGSSTDTPIPGDYDGNGLANLAVWNPNTGTWRGSVFNNSQPISKKWGIAGDVPISADLDYDKKTDVVIWRPGNGTWYVLTSSSQFLNAFTISWGISGDIPVSGK